MNEESKDRKEQYFYHDAKQGIQLVRIIRTQQAAWAEEFSEQNWQIDNTYFSLVYDRGPHWRAISKLKAEEIIRDSA